MGCKHEHIHRSLACAQCVAAAQDFGKASCYYCKRGPDPHRCPVMVQARPDLNRRKLDGTPTTRRTEEVG